MLFRSTLPESVTEIGGNTFRCCSGLTSITLPESVTEIGGFAFAECRTLTNITLPKSVMKIGLGAFSSCGNLESIKVDENNKVYDSRDNCNAIIEKSSSALIVGCKNTEVPSGVTQIGERAFDGCSGLTSITLPESVTEIGEFAFAGCSGLTSITLPESVTEIGEFAFTECSNLESIKVNENNKVYDSRENCNAIIEKSSNTLIVGCKIGRAHV